MQDRLHGSPIKLEGGEVSGRTRKRGPELAISDRSKNGENACSVRCEPQIDVS